jgi:tetratricopeptide (TPR) repeat protein
VLAVARCCRSAFHYRYHREYQAVLWARAEHTEALVSSYTEIAELLNLPVKTLQEQAVIIQAVRVWLQSHPGWLLILDNADELELLEPFVPPRLGGHLIITTRASALGRFAQRLSVTTFSEDQGSLFLLRRAGLITLHMDATQAHPQDQELARQITHEVGGLPLALDQIGAYLETTACGLADYWQEYQQHRIELLSEYRGLSTDHPQPVATVWSLSFQRVAERNPAAADLLRLCAFLAPDATQESLFTQSAATLPSTLSQLLPNGYQLNRIIEALRAYSFVTRDTKARTLTLHRLVQAVLRESLSSEEQRPWMEYIVNLLDQAFPESNLAFPENDFTSWSQCEACVPHAILAALWIQKGPIMTLAAARLLDSLGHYLTNRGRYKEAEPFLLQTLVLCEQLLGLQHPAMATRLVHPGELSVEMGRFPDAEQFYLQALAILEQQLGPKCLEVATCLYDLGVVYLEQASIYYPQTAPGTRASWNIALRERLGTPVRSSGQIYRSGNAHSALAGHL